MRAVAVLLFIIPVYSTRFDELAKFGIVDILKMPGN